MKLSSSLIKCDISAPIAHKHFTTDSLRSEIVTPPIKQVKNQDVEILIQKAHSQPASPLQKKNPKEKERKWLLSYRQVWTCTCHQHSFCSLLLGNAIYFGKVFKIAHFAQMRNLCFSSSCALIHTTWRLPLLNLGAEPWKHSVSHRYFTT